MILALITPTLLAGVAGTVDFTNYQRQINALQDAADHAALASVNEASLQGWNIETAKVIAANYVDANLGSNSGAQHAYRASSTVDQKNQRVTVDIEMDHFPYFFAALFPTPQITVSATAISASTGSVCVIGLHEPGFMEMPAALHFAEKSQIKAGSCSIISNSPARFSFRHDRDAKISSSFVCVSGGLYSGSGGGGQFSTPPVTDCPPVKDPLKDRVLFEQPWCDYNDVHITSGMEFELSPGVYCGGLRVSGDAKVKLKPGVYSVLKGPLSIEDQATFKGVHVGFFLAGDGSVINMEPDTTISLVAPKESVMAGILFSEDPTIPHSFKNRNPLGDLKDEDFHSDVRIHKIQSNNARNLLGTIYLPISILKIGSEEPIADESAYTAIVVGRLWLLEGSPLVLNTDFAATDVPMPTGLQGEKTIRLAQ